MALIGFTFRKLSVEKKKVMKSSVKIVNNTMPTSVTKKDFSINGKKKHALKVDVTFTVQYEECAEIEMLCEVLWGVADEKEASTAEALWSKSKKLPKKFATDLMNAVLSRCLIQGVVLSREMKLPIPIQLPKIKVDKA